MSAYFSEKYKTLTPYTPGEQPKDTQYVKLNTNESPYPPAPTVLDAITQEEISKLRLYSDPTNQSLKQKLADLYGLKPDNIFLGNGSDEILSFAFMAFADSKGVAYPDISYGFYSVYAALYGAGAQEIPLTQNYSVNYQDYCGIGKMCVLANPNAPTGKSIPVWQIEEILKSNPGCVVVIDEAYVDFGGESCYPLLDSYENLLVVRTFSKSRCMAGARLGYAFGSPALIEDLEKIKFSTNPFNVDRLAQVLGEATVEANDYYMEKCREIIATRTETGKALQKMGFEVLESQTNFLFAKSPAISGFDLYLELKKRGILVRHFAKPRTEAFVRITIGTPEQMQVFLAAVKDILKGESL